MTIKISQIKIKTPALISKAQIYIGRSIESEQRIWKEEKAFAFSGKTNKTLI